MNDITINPKALRPQSDTKRRSLIARAVAQVDIKGRPTGEYAVDFQYDLRDPENHFPNRSHPHLYCTDASRKSTHFVGLTAEQMRGLVHGVPAKDMRVTTYMGNEVKEFSLRADLITTRNPHGDIIYLVDTDGGVYPSEFPLTPTVVENQRRLVQRCELYGTMDMSVVLGQKQSKVQRPSSNPAGLREVSGTKGQNSLDPSYN